MVKADKARAVEDMLLRMAQSNQLRSKVTEKQLIDLLGQINQQESNATQTRIVVSLKLGGFFFLFILDFITHNLGL
jgi:DNA-binding TFAR19-related protein (PDSD5 family)